MSAGREVVFGPERREPLRPSARLYRPNAQRACAGVRGVATLEQIGKQGWRSLNPGRYVGVAAAEG